MGRPDVPRDEDSAVGDGAGESKNLHWAVRFWGAYESRGRGFFLSGYLLMATHPSPLTFCQLSKHVLNFLG